MNNIEKFEDFLDRMQGLLDKAKKQGHIIVRVEDLEKTFPEFKESEDEKKPNGAIVMEDFNEGDGFYKVNLAYLNKKQVEDIEKFVEKWNETEDERIRKAIIESLPKYGYLPQTSVKVEDAVAWLEKQGKQEKPQVYETKDGEIIIYSESEGYKVIDPHFGKPIDKVEPIEWSGKINSRNAKGVLKEMLDKKLKSADNTEPKFKSGDWITNGDYTWKIVEVKPLDYILQSQDGNIVDDTISYVDGVFDSFTIQDAKDGDVLVSQYNKPFIYNGNLDSFLIGSYCGISTEGRFNVATEKCRWAGNVNIHPATKEQRDLLFQKMKEAGYEWDDEKKELSKIKQNPAWSEEDECYMSECISAIATKDSWSFEEKRKTKYWLKSLKERVQPQQKVEWSEEDERKINRIYSILWQAADTHAFSTTCRLIGDKECIELQDFLKSLKQRIGE